MMTGTTGKRMVRAAEQIAWQRRAAAVLAKILERAAVEGLPPMAWTVGAAGAALLGQAVAHPMDRRRDDFSTWRVSVGTWAGQAADHERERTGSDGTTRLVDQWERLQMAGEKIPGVTITLTAELYEED
jgi:hypothetical protein